MTIFLPYLRRTYHFIKQLFPNHGKKNVIRGIRKKSFVRGGGIFGDNNVLLSESILGDVKVRCFGDGHILSIGKDVVFKSGQIKFENSKCQLKIGPQTTIEEAQFFIAEDGMSITIGTDCMLSGRIRVYTTDGHSIIDANTGKRINPAKKVVIGNHVWIGSDVKILKGVEIGSNSIIASGAVVTGKIPPNSIAAGCPAKVVKQGVTWHRERL